MKIVWSPTARRQAQAVVDFIAVDRPQAAEQWFDALARRVEYVAFDRHARDKTLDKAIRVLDAATTLCTAYLLFAA